MAEIFGKIGNDLLFGTPENDLIDLLEGNDDVVSAGEGNDTVNGGLGDDNMLGAAGDDQLFGGEGTDYILGGDGNDTLEGGTEVDILIGGDGNDSVLGGDGNDLILGDIDDANGIGDDVLYGGAGDDKITGGKGNDSVYGEEDQDIVSGGFGDDLVRGGEDNDLVFGAFDNDSVYGDGGDDEVSGGTGNDLVYGGEGADTLIGVSKFSPQPGIGEIDELTGDEGNDIFKLGQISATGNQDVFYDDGDTTTSGDNDYALITDFDVEDKIQLVGEIDDYSLAASPDGFPYGTAIYLNDGETPELIAIIKDIDPNTLDLHNPEQFEGSTPIPEVSVTAIPDIPLTEAEGNTGSFNFQLSEPAPEGGLTIYFKAGDDDPFPEYRDVNLNIDANVNIEDFNLIDLPDRTSSFTIPEGETIASFSVTPFVDNFIEPDETIFVDLIPQADYTVNPDSDYADLVISEGISLIEGTETADDLQGTNDAEILSGLADNDTLVGEAGNDILVGGIGNDTLIGGEGSDRLIGVNARTQPGLNEVDELTGGTGADTFVLAQLPPGGETVNFYDDGDINTAGTEDYALITDFELDIDAIALAGEASDYSLGASPEGTGVYINDGTSPELIAIVAGIEVDSLSLNNSSQFVFD